MTKHNSLFMAGFVSLAALFVASAGVAGFIAADFAVTTAKVSSANAKTLAAIPITVAPMVARKPTIVVTTEYTTFAPKVERVATPHPAIAPSATIEATVEIPVTFAPTMASEQSAKPFTFARAVLTATPEPTITPIPFPTSEPPAPKIEPVVIEPPKPEPIVEELDSPIATPASEQLFTPKQ